MTGGATAPPRGRIVLLLLGVIFTWGAAFSGIKIALREVGPGGLSFGRIGVAALAYAAMLPFVRAPKPASGEPASSRQATRRRRLPSVRPAPAPGDLWRFVVVGLTASSGYHLAVNWGEQHVSAGVASLVVAAMPAMVVVMAAVVLRERLGLGRAAGVAIAFGGVALLVLADGSELEVDRLTGVVVTTAAPLLWAIYTIVSKPLSARYDGVRLNLYGTAVGLVVLLPFAVGDLDDLVSMSAEAWAWTVFLGVFSTAASFVIYSYALRYWTTSAVAAFVYLVPIASLAWAWLLLDEVPNASALLGGALIIGGVVLVQRSTRPAAPQGQEQGTLAQTGQPSA